MRSEILSVGTELLLGHITDTNASWLAQQLTPLGIDLFYVSQVGDNLERLGATVRRARERSDLVVITGGLGPTEDDLTREAIAAVLDETPHVEPKLEAESPRLLRRARHRHARAQYQAGVDATVSHDTAKPHWHCARLVGRT